jgi:hypothetical protein
MFRVRLPLLLLHLNPEADRLISSSLLHLCVQHDLDGLPSRHQFARSRRRRGRQVCGEVRPSFLFFILRSFIAVS